MYHGDATFWWYHRLTVNGAEHSRINGSRSTCGVSRCFRWCFVAVVVVVYLPCWLRDNNNILALLIPPYTNSTNTGGI